MRKQEIELFLGQIPGRDFDRYNLSSTFVDEVGYLRDRSNVRYAEKLETACRSRDKSSRETFF
jgi:hypothetical protein